MLVPMPSVARVRLEPWSLRDFTLLQRLNAPEMTRHLGGPETEEQLLRRHRAYAQATPLPSGRMFRVVMLPRREAVGNIGYWVREWQDAPVYEIGWNILLPYQGRGLATAAAVALLQLARRSTPVHRFVHAFPAVTNPSSNAVCRKAGFAFMAECDFEYPVGNPLRCNDWRFDLAS